MTTRSQYVEEARKWIGTPYHHQGSIKQVGVDCVGLIIGVGIVTGLIDPEFRNDPNNDWLNYSAAPDGVTMKQICDEHFTRVEMSDMKIADIVLVSIDTNPQHLGIIGNYRHGGYSIIHAYKRPNTVGSVIESRLMFARNFRFVQLYRIPQLTD